MAKKYLKKIADALSGVDSDMPVIKSPSSEMGRSVSTPKGNSARKEAAEAEAEALRIRKQNNPPDQVGKYGTYRSSEESAAWKRTQSANESARNADADAALRRRAEAERVKGQSHRDVFERARQESRDFYNSDKGKNTDDFVTMNGDKARNPDKRAGSGFGVKIASGTPTKTPKQISDFIGQHAAGNHGAKLDDFSAGLKVNNNMSKGKPEPKRPDFMSMHEIPESKPQGGNYMTKPDNYVTKPSGGPLNKGFDVGQYFKNAKLATASKARKSKFTLNDTDMAIGAAGATGYGLGEGINAAMDQSYENGKMVNNQQNAHSYWTRKKNGQ